MTVIDDGRIEVGDVIQHFKRELLPPERTGSPEYLYTVLAVAIHENTGEPYFPEYLKASQFPMVEIIGTRETFEKSRSKFEKFFNEVL